MDALDEFAREPPVAERSGYVVAVPTLGGAHVSPRFARSVINADRRLVDRMVAEDRTQRRLASALGCR